MSIALAKSMNILQEQTNIFFICTPDLIILERLINIESVLIEDLKWMDYGLMS